MSVVTLAALPSSNSSHSATRRYITAQLCALRDHILMKQFKVYAYSPAPIPLPDNQVLNPKAIEDSVSNNIVENQEPTVLVPSVPQTEAPHSPHKHDGPYSKLDENYLSMAKHCADDLLNAANATEKDGWTVVGTSKNIHIMKKVPAKGEVPINCVKGRGEINCPPDFVMRIIMDPSRASILDDMLKEMKTVEDISDAMQLVHLHYKAVWPTTARDFSIINVFGRIDSQTRVHAAKSVVDPRIPEEKGYVRGEVISGGYVIKDYPGNPEKAEVIYLTQVDLKGNVPAFIINKVTESQPQCVSHLRSIAEADYNKLRRNPIKMKQFEDQFPIPDIIKDIPEIASKPEVEFSKNEDNPAQQCLVVTAEVHNTDSISQDIPDDGSDSVQLSSTSTEVQKDSITEALQLHTGSDVNTDDDLFDEKKVPSIPISAVLKKLPKYHSDNVNFSVNGATVSVFLIIASTCE